MAPAKNSQNTEKFEDEEDSEIEVPKVTGLQMGKNYVTTAGFKVLQEEFKLLKTKERPEVVKIVEWAAGNGDRSENGDYLYGKRKLREIDRRLGYLAKQLDRAEVVDPTNVNSKQVKFGATVTIRDEDDNEKTWSIVGVDEAEVAKKKISWLSPLANALLNSKVGDLVQFRSPKGVQEVEIVKLEYITHPE